MCAPVRAPDAGKGPALAEGLRDRRPWCLGAREGALGSESGRWGLEKCRWGAEHGRALPRAADGSAALTPPRRGPTRRPRRLLPTRRHLAAPAPPRTRRTAGQAPPPARPSCSGRTGRAAGGRPAAAGGASWRTRIRATSAGAGAAAPRAPPRPPSRPATTVERGRPRRPAFHRARGIPGHRAGGAAPAGAAGAHLANVASPRAFSGRPGPQDHRGQVAARGSDGRGPGLSAPHPPPPGPTSPPCMGALASCPDPLPTCLQSPASTPSRFTGSQEFCLVLS